MKRAPLLLVPLLAAACAMPEPRRSPERVDIPRMTKVAFHNVSPGAATDEAPVVIHRLGEKYGRVDYPPDPRDGTHRLVVVREPYAFVIDRAAGRGYRLLDEGPTYVFHAPVADHELRDRLPTPLRDLEFGRELEFLASQDATPRRTGEEGGEPVREYALDFRDGYSLIVVTRGDPEVPARLEILQGGRILRAYRYEEHRRDLLPSPAVFQVPEGIEIVPAPE